jgi:hypothetical protein
MHATADMHLKLRVGKTARSNLESMSGNVTLIRVAGMRSACLGRDVADRAIFMPAVTRVRL